MSEKLGKESAFPIAFDNPECHGMSKRFYAACCAMQGLLSQNYYNPYELESNEIYSKKAYSLADELLKQENL